MTLARDSGQAIRRTIIDIAHEAGAILRHGWGAKPAFRTKSSALDLVTEYDERAEAAIVERLRAAFPTHAIVGEEGARIGGQGPDAPTWYIDPLDGTANFAHGVPQFAVSIGLIEGREPVVGVVHAPVLGFTFAGGPGLGATLDEKPIEVSEVSDVVSAMLATGFASQKGRASDNFAEFMALTGKVHGTRRFGSAALDLAFVAAGWFDAYWERHISPWDLAGGAAVVLGAGGRVSDLDGGVFDARTGRCLASNGKIHEELGGVLREVAQSSGTPWP